MPDIPEIRSSEKESHEITEMERNINPIILNKKGDKSLNKIPSTSLSNDDTPVDHDPRRIHGLARWVGTRVLTPANTVGLPDVENEFQSLSPREKADLLHEKLMAFYLTEKVVRGEQKQNVDVSQNSDAGETTDTKPTSRPKSPVDPYLISEIKTLWEDQEAQETFSSLYADSRTDERFYRNSQMGKDYKAVNQAIADTKAVYEEEAKELFLQRASRPDQVSAARGRTTRFARELIRLEKQKQSIVTLKEKTHTAENTDVAANIMFETLRGYHDQLNEGFVWLPSRIGLHVETVEALQNGRWPVLRGEAGTGKSEQADAAVLVLTGEQPTHLACSQNTGERNLIADKDIDPKTGGSYETYGPAMQAATGYEDSLGTAPQFSSGRGVRFDESGRLGELGYAIIKELRQKRTATTEDIQRFKDGKQIDPDKLLHGKPVLPGFTAIFTTNPEGPRYPNRTEPDAALRRELSYITVDYPEQTVENPELYEFMLAGLMDNNYHIAVPKAELAPAYFLTRADETLPDGRKVIAQQVLKEDPTDLQHGMLYRLSFAVRSLQDAFNNGNTDSIPEDALRYAINRDGSIRVNKTNGDPLTLSNSTITLKEVRSWMEGFKDRNLKDDPNYQVETLAEWLQVKLNTYLTQADEVDRDKIQGLFDYYHLFAEGPNGADLRDSSLLTPKQIGYLSPRVPRPLHTTNPIQEEKPTETVSGETEQNPQPTVHEDIQIMLEDGSTVLVNPQPISVQMRETS